MGLKFKVYYFKVFGVAACFLFLLLPMLVQDRYLLKLTKIYEPIYKSLASKKRNEEPEATCVPKQQLVFLKTHKTGGTTLARIVEQYGVDHKLNIVRKIGTGGSIHFGNKRLQNSSVESFLPPRGVEPGDYNNYKYDVFSLHSIYNRPALESFINGTPFFFTILRDPIKQFESAFDFFGAGKNINKTSKSERLAEFVSNITYYYPRVRRMAMKYIHNDQTFDLGIESTLLTGDKANETLNRLDKEIDLVLINEYYDESLLILKRKLCWRFEDILYLARNQRLNRATITDDVIEKIKRWNSADVALYNYFVIRLKEHILEYGEKFQTELQAFREMTKMLYDICVGDIDQRKRGRKMKYVPSQNVSSIRCQDPLNSSEVCTFTGGYQIHVNLQEVCRRVTSIETALNKEIRKMMKSSLEIESFNQKRSYVDENK